MQAATPVAAVLNKTVETVAEALGPVASRLDSAPAPAPEARTLQHTQSPLAKITVHA